MTVDDKYFKPVVSGYEFKLKIGSSDYSSDLYRVVIATSVTTPYQVITLELFLDPTDIMLERIYGQTLVKLSVGMLLPFGVPMEFIDFELFIIDSNFPVSPSRAQQTSGIQKERVPFSIVTVCREPFKTMTTLVNKVYYADTVRNIITDLVSTNTNADLSYDIEEENKEKIDQILIPPSTLYKSIQYLDRSFGLYNGIPVIFCLYDNKIRVFNLTKRIDKSQTYTMYHLASDNKDNDEIIRKSMDGKNYYTYDALDNTYNGNALFSVMAPTLRFIVKPRDTLSYLIEENLEDVCLNQGIISKNKKIYFDSGGLPANKRTRYYIDHTGYEYTDTFIKSFVSKQISSLSTVRFNIENNLPLLNLMNVGEPVKLKVGTLEMAQFAGKYILKSSQINFEKTADWNAVCNIALIRTNKSSI